MVAAAAAGKQPIICRRGIDVMLDSRIAIEIEGGGVRREGGDIECDESWSEIALTALRTSTGISSPLMLFKSHVFQQHTDQLKKSSGSC